MDRGDGGHRDGHERHGHQRLAAATGVPQFQMGDVLVVVYATLFLGLLFRAVMVVAVGADGSRSSASAGISACPPTI